MKDFNIEKYINGELHGQELIEIEEALQSDSNLKSEIEFQKNIIADLKTGGLSSKIKRIQDRQKKKKIFIKIIFISLLIILSLLIYILAKKKPVSPNINPAQLNQSEDTVQLSSEKLNMNQLIDSSQHDSTHSNILINKINKESNPPKKEGNKLKPVDKFKIKPTKPINNPISITDKEIIDLAIEEYTIPDELSILRSEEMTSSLDSIKHFFNAENYNQGLSILNQSNIPDDNKKFIRSHFYFKKNSFYQSIQQLKNIKKVSVSKNRQYEIDWYLYLNYIASGSSKFLNAKKVLHECSKDTRNPYINKMKKIELEINKFMK